MEAVEVIPPRGRRAYDADDDPCAECSEMDCRCGRWLLLPLIVVVMVAIIYAMASGEKHHPGPAPPPSGSLAGELSDDLSDG